MAPSARANTVLANGPFQCHPSKYRQCCRCQTPIDGIPLDREIESLVSIQMNLLNTHFKSNSQIILRTCDAVVSKPVVEKKPARIKLNIGGSCLEIMLFNLRRLPASRLGRLRTAVLVEDDVVELCDEYRPDVEEFFFDRSPRICELIVNFYRHGKLHYTEDICAMDFHDELIYWGIDESRIESCCQMKYLQKLDVIVQDLKKSQFSVDHSKDNLDFGRCFPETRKTIWMMMERPKSSRSAKVLAVLSVLFIGVSLINLTISTLPSMRPAHNESSLHMQEPRFIFVVESCCMMWFTVEYLVRLISSPNRGKFLKGILNGIDLFAILPFYLTMILEVSSVKDSTKLSSMRKLLPAFRVLRIMRILKLARHSVGLQSLGFTLRECYKELGMLAIFLMTTILLFSSLIYFAEREVNRHQFKSIPHSFWWAAITITTVGYGDMCPVSLLGKIIGTLCCICGVIVIALPIPIIVNNFAGYYNQQQRRERSKENLFLDEPSSEISSANARNCSLI